MEFERTSPGLYRFFPSPGHPRKIWRWAAIILLIMVLAVLQDYVFSQLRNTGFYLSESLLYSCLWLFFLPLIFIELRILSGISPHSRLRRMVIILLLSCVMSLVHLLLFTSFFIAVSALVFTPAHRFMAIFQNALTNQLYIIFLVYLLFPFLNGLIRSSRRIAEKSEYTDHISVKVGTKTVAVPVGEVQCILTDKPYSLVYAGDKKYLDNRTLRSFADTLDPEIFLRVHRSAIVNRRFVKELSSRQNGDYDALLSSGQVIRLSRHLRANWEMLLH